MASKLGQWSFIIGVVIAIVIGLFSNQLPGNIPGVLTLVLVLLGIVVGLLNITATESTSFLVASIALLATGTAHATLKVIDGVGLPLGSWLAGVVTQIGVFVAPAAIIVALKAIQSLAKE